MRGPVRAVAAFACAAALVLAPLGPAGGACPASAAAAQASAHKTVTDKAAVKKALKRVSADMDKAASFASKLSSARSELSEQATSLARAKVDMAALAKKRTKAADKLSALEEAAARAERCAAAARAEMDAGGQVGLFEVLFGQARFEDIDSRDYLLEKVVADRTQAAERARKQVKSLDVRTAALSKKVANKEKALSKTIAAGGVVAFKIEKSASQIRTYEKDVDALLGTLDPKNASVKKAAKRAEAAGKRRSESREVAAQSAGGWYDLVDSLSKTTGAVSFGEGADFKMDKAAFVEKWGAAIRAFFKAYSAEAGCTVALAEYGDEMAAQAYEHKVDPRLCAAVSVVESSGGLYCIKEHNAWGWGASDSNPHAAPSWESWEAGIRAWHEGVAGSTTGLAEAVSLDKFGEIYCSSSKWTADVAERMEQISELAR